MAKSIHKNLNKGGGELVIRISPSRAGDFVRRHPWGVGIVTCFVTIVAFFLLRGIFASADLSVFSPQTCLGGWRNTQNAQGMPDVDKWNPDSFNEKNSAYLTQSVSQIFCGNFVGELPGDAEAKKVTLKLSWAIKYPEVQFEPLVDAIPESSAAPEDSTKVEDPNEDFSSSEVNEENSDLNTSGGGGGGSSSDTPDTEEASEEPNDNTSPASETEEAGTGDSGGEETSSDESSSESASDSESESSSSDSSSDSNSSSDSGGSSDSSDSGGSSDSSSSSQSKANSIFSFELWKKIIPIARAIEIATDELVADTPEETPKESEEKTPDAPEESPEESEEKVVDSRPRPPEPMFTIRYTLDGETWKDLGTVTPQEIGRKDFEIPVEDIATEADLENLQINIQTGPLLEEESTVFLDGMTVEVQYDQLSRREIDKLPRIEVDSEEIFGSEQGGFSPREEIEFEIELGGEATETAESPFTEEDITPGEEVPPAEEETPADPLPETEESSPLSLLHSIKNVFSFSRDVFVASTANAAEIVKKKVLKAEVFGPDGKRFAVTPIIEEVGGKVKITVPREVNQFRPGLYKMKVEVLGDEKVFVSTQSFAWGVLAINTDKSSYAPGESANLSIGALTPQGHTICDADLRLQIESPSGDISVLRTSDGSIESSETCGRNNVTDSPDYSAVFDTAEVGTYIMTLTNLDEKFTVTDEFVVKESAPFVVERSAATRINPFASTYQMNIRVRSLAGFQGEVVETIPETFDISSSTPSASFQKNGDVRKGRWNVSIPAGGYQDISYIYQAPMISPELYILGPVSLEQNGTSLYTEEREWQLASDAACNAVTTGNWNDGTKWSGCSGVGGVPDSTDDVTINSGVTMTVTANASVKSVVVASNGAGTANGITINSGISLSVTEGVLMNAPTALTSTIDVGAGTLNMASTTINGSATASRFATITVSTGTINTTGNVSFTGTAAQARFIFTGAGTLNIGGNFGSGGTLTTTSNGTINFNGSVAQTIGAYATYNHLTINNTSGGVSFAGSATISGNLTVNTGSLTIGGVSVTVTGTTSISGSTDITSTVGTKLFVGLVTINSGGTWTNTGNELVNLRGGITNNGTFTAGAGSYTFDTNSQAINGTAFSVGTVTVTGAAVVVTSNVDLTVTAALSGTGTFTLAANKTLTLGGTSAITTLNITASGTIVNYNGVAAQTIKALTYQTLKINNTAATGASLAASTTVTTLTIGDIAPTARFQDAGFTLNLTASSVLNLTQGTYDLGAATATTFPSFGTVNISSGTTVEYGATAAQTVNASLSYQNLLITGLSTKTSSGNLSVAGNLTVTGGAGTVLDVGPYNHTIAGNVVVTTAGGILNASSSVMTISGNMSGAGQYQGQTGTTTFSGGGTQTIGVTTQVFNNVIVAKTTGTSASLTTATTINGNLTVTTGTFGMGGVTVTVNGATSISDTLTLTSATGAKTFVGLVTINPGGLWNETAAAIPTFQGGLTNNGTFTASTGIHTFNTNPQAIMGSSTVSIPSVTITGVTLSIYNIPSVTVGTALSGTGEMYVYQTTLNIGGASTITTLTPADSSTVNYTGAAQTVKAVDYINLGLSGSGAKTLTGLALVYGNLTTSGTITAATAAAFQINQNLTVGSGTTFTVGAFDFTALGPVSVSGTLAHSSNVGTKIYGNTVTIESGGSWTNVGNESISFYSDLTHNGTTFSAGSGVYSFSFSQDINGSSALTIPNLSIDGSTTYNGSSSLTVSTSLSGSGDFSIETILNLGGTNTVATFSVFSGSTVNYNGTSAQFVRSALYDTLKINNTAATGASLEADTSAGVLTIGDMAATARFQDNGYVLDGVTLNHVQGTYDLGTTTVATTFPSFTTENLSSGTTIEYGAGVTQTIDPTVSYRNLLVTGAAPKSFADNSTVTIAENFTINIPTGAHNIELGDGGTYTIGGNIVLTQTESRLFTESSYVELSGSVTGSGVFDGGTGTLKMVGGSAASLSALLSQTYYNVVIEKTGGAQITIGDTLNVDNALTITTGTFNIGAVSSSVLGTTTVSDTLQISSPTGAKSFSGPVVINSGGVWNNSGNEAVTFAGGLTHNGATFTAGTGIYTFTGNQTITGSSPISIPTFVISSGTTVTNNSTVGLTVDTSLQHTGGALTQGTNAILNIGASITISTLTASATGNTVNYTGGTQTVKPTTYYNLGLSGSGDKTLTSVSTVNGDFTLSGTASTLPTVDLAIAGNLTIGAGSTFNQNNNAFSVTGTTTVAGTFHNSSNTGTKTFVGPVLISSGGEWNSTGDSPFVFRSGLTHDGSTFVSGNGTHTFNTNSQAIGGASAITIPNITVTGVTLTNNSTAGLTASSTLEGTGTLVQATNAVLNIGGSSTITTLTASASGNTVSYMGTTGAQTIKSGTYHHVTINKNGLTATLGGAITVNGNLTNEDAVFDSASYPIVVKGNWTGNSGFVAGTGTVTFNGTGTQTINSPNTWYGLTIVASTTRTVFFEALSTQTIASGGTLTFMGTENELLVLDSTSDENHWFLSIDETGVTQNITYTSATMSDASDGATVVAPETTNYDGGNNFNWSFANMSCSTSAGSTSFGTLTPASVSTASTNATTTMTCGGSGCTLYVHDAGNGGSPGLYAPAATSTPLIPSLSTLLSAGTAGYGIQAATSTAGSGVSIALNALYALTGNNVGGLTIADTQLASTTGSVSDREIVVTHKAAVSSVTPQGSYTDTITYSCVAN